jgi:hypothetical protein
MFLKPAYTYIYMLERLLKSCHRLETGPWCRNHLVRETSETLPCIVSHGRVSTLQGSHCIASLRDSRIAQLAPRPNVVFTRKTKIPASIKPKICLNTTCAGSLEQALLEREQHVLTIRSACRFGIFDIKRLAWNKCTIFGATKICAAALRAQ